jgi:hypothetical protein
VDRDEAEDEALDREQPLEEDSVERELALVALEAAALSRRVFPEQEGRGRVTRAGRQVMLALALVDPLLGLTRLQLSRALALDGEETQETLAELLAFGLIEYAELSPEDDGDDEAYCLTTAGATTARELARSARKFLPGWPPRQ